MNSYTLSKELIAKGTPILLADMLSDLYEECDYLLYRSEMFGLTDAELERLVDNDAILALYDIEFV